MGHPEVLIRDFLKADAKFCVELRAWCFTHIFNQEIGEEAAMAGADAYQAQDFLRFSIDSKIFILAVKQIPSGFLVLKQVDFSSAELVLIYLNPSCHGKGFGRLLVEHMETWIQQNWSQIKEVFVDTVIPKYNGKFYERLGYRYKCKTVCSFKGISVPANRYHKFL